MIVDIYAHVFPRRVIEHLETVAPDLGFMKTRIPNVPQLFEFDQRFREMDEAAEDYVQIVSLASPPLEVLTTPEQGAELARIANDSMAEIVERHRDHFPGFVASLSLADMETAMAEIERAIDGLGARGIQIFTDVGGRPLDDPEYAPVFAEMARRGLPIWMHPTRSPNVPDYPAESESTLDMWLILGWPYATAVTMIRLVMAGLFERHPGIKIITHHMGGMIPFHEARVSQALHRHSRNQAREESGGGLYMRRAPGDMLHLFYADTAMHGSVSATQCGLDFFGENKVVFASDAPFGLPSRHLDAIDRMEIDDRARGKILHGNAERLMRVPADG